MNEWSGGLNAFYRKEFAKCALALAARTCGVEAVLIAAERRQASVAFARQLDASKNLSDFRAICDSVEG